MKKLLCILLCVFIVSAGTQVLAVESAENLFYTADFSYHVPNELSKTVYGSPSLSVLSGSLIVGGNQWSTTVINDAEYSKLFNNSVPYDNYTITAEVTDTVADVLPGIAFRGTDGNVYSVCVRNSADKTRAVANLMRIKDGSPSGGTVINTYNGIALSNKDYMNKYTTSTLIVPGTYYKIKVSVSDTTVKAWLGEDLILECSSESGLANYTALEFDKGSIGIMNVNGKSTGMAKSFKVYKNEASAPDQEEGFPQYPEDALPQYVDIGDVLYESSFDDEFASLLEFKDVYCKDVGVGLSVSDGKLNIKNNSAWDTKALNDKIYQMITSGAAYDNYIISVDVTASRSNEVPAIAFRATAGNAYGIYARVVNGKTLFNLMKITDYSTSGGTVIDASKKGDEYIETYSAEKFTAGERYKFTVVVKDNNVKAYWNEKLVMDYTGIMYAKGSVGVMTGTNVGTITLWDNLVIAKPAPYKFVSFSISDGTADIVPDTELVLSFNASTAAQTVMNFITVNNGYENVGYFEAENVDDLNVKLKFTGGLEYNKTYTVTLKPGVTSTDGVMISNEYKTTFSTVKDKVIFIENVNLSGKTAVIDLNNLTAEQKKTVLVVCAYRADGEFAAVKYLDVTLEPFEETTPAVTFDNIDGVVSITAFLWTDYSNLLPVSRGFVKNI